MEKYPSCMNIDFFDKGRVTTQKILVLKSSRVLNFHSGYYILGIGKTDFHLPHFHILGDINMKVNDMIYCDSTQ